MVKTIWNDLIINQQGGSPQPLQSLLDFEQSLAPGSAGPLSPAAEEWPTEKWPSLATWADSGRLEGKMRKFSGKVMIQADSTWFNQKKWIKVGSQPTSPTFAVFLHVFPPFFPWVFPIFVGTPGARDVRTECSMQVTGPWSQASIVESDRRKWWGFHRGKSMIY